MFNFCYDFISTCYSVEILDCKHVPRTDTEALVEIPRDSKYKIRMSNANDHMCMVNVELDGIFIGQSL